jgi:putative ABC transport system substrate-binding protein
MPGLSRAAVVGTSTAPGHAQALRETEIAAKALEVERRYLDVRGPGDLEPAYRSANAWHAEAILGLLSPVLIVHARQVAALATTNRLPLIYQNSEGVRAGMLMSLGVSQTELFGRAATHVDRLLRGAKPADLPVEQPTKFELVVNLGTAKTLGLTIPPAVLTRADEVIR